MKTSYSITTEHVRALMVDGRYTEYESECGDSFGTFETAEEAIKTAREAAEWEIHCHSYRLSGGRKEGITFYRYEACCDQRDDDGWMLDSEILDVFDAVPSEEIDLIKGRFDDEDEDEDFDD